MKKLILVYIIILSITSANRAQAANKERPIAAKCMWRENKKASEMTSPKTQIAGFLIFLNKDNQRIRVVDYNPITRTVRYRNFPMRGATDREPVKEKSFPKNTTLREIGRALGIDTSIMQEIKCNQVIKKWEEEK